MALLREVKSGDYVLLNSADEEMGTLSKNKSNHQWQFYIGGQFNFKSFNSVGDCAEWLGDQMGLEVIIEPAK